MLYWDKDSKGFGLRVTPTGLSKFIAQGRVRGTTQDVRVTIGSYGAWTVDKALGARVQCGEIEAIVAGHGAAAGVGRTDVAPIPDPLP